MIIEDLILAIIITGLIVGFAVWAITYGVCVSSRQFNCSHNFEQVVDTQKGAAFLCTKCGKVKKVKL
jgi:multisubunit Na+/H+ antiporter MnhC subunit